MDANNEIGIGTPMTILNATILRDGYLDDTNQQQTVAIGVPVQNPDAFPLPQ
jgi:hypothetical protein